MVPDQEEFYGIILFWQQGWKYQWGGMGMVGENEPWFTPWCTELIHHSHHCCSLKYSSPLDDVIGFLMAHIQLAMLALGGRAVS